jgi:hypothetical protein
MAACFVPRRASEATRADQESVPGERSAPLTKLWPTAGWRRSFFIWHLHELSSPWPVLGCRRHDHHADVDRPALTVHGLAVAGRLIRLLDSRPRASRHRLRWDGGIARQVGSFPMI